MVDRKILLTERQLQVLKLREGGLTQTEIARRLGTSRANISATEKSALQKIERAKNTLKIVRMIRAPLQIPIEGETDLNEVVKRIYREADRAGIRIPQDFPTLASHIQREGRKKVRGRRVLAGLEIAVAADGEILVS
jgi:hypothetical protein